MRVRVSLWMLVATAFGCFIMICQGKHMRNEGDSLDKRELAIQEKMREIGLKEAAAKN